MHSAVSEPEFVLPIICGSTGTGKSQLAIELAQKFNGEIINADAVQMYANLPIVTNKVKTHEMAGIPHHLLGILDPYSSESWTVHDFQRAVLPLIADIHSRRKLPILVGGTHYYLESILWDFLLTTASSSSPSLPPSTSTAEVSTHQAACPPPSSSVLDQYQHLDNQSLHQKLQQVDPISAVELHPNNRRKVLRALEVFHTTASSRSTLLAEQHQHCPSRSGQRRYTPLQVPILWLDCAFPVLEKRLHDRVDDMMSQGMLQEVDQFYQTLSQHLSSSTNNSSSTPPPVDKGILQSIGLKEFYNYIQLSPPMRQSAVGEKLLQECIQSVKVANRQYAKRQIKWIKNRFLHRPMQKAYWVFRLDSSQKANWHSHVYTVAESIVQTFLQASCAATIPKQPMKEEEEQEERANMLLSKLCISPESVDSRATVEFGSFACEVCQQIFTVRDQWQVHMKSRRHYKKGKSLLKKKGTQVGAL